jgi:predicted HicB family RNase H-like nuclease
MDPKRKRGHGPEPKYGARSEVKAVRVPGGLWDKLQTIAERDGISRNELVARTLIRKAQRELRS